MNQGVNGASTANWVSTGGGTPLADALIFITRYGVTQVSVMLGTNDANLDNRNATDYQTNLQSTINTLVANGVTSIVLNQSPYIATTTNPGANTLLNSYDAAMMALVVANPGVVALGDTTAFSVFQANTATYYQPDGLHPNDAGATALAGLWETSYP